MSFGPQLPLTVSPTPSPRPSPSPSLSLVALAISPPSPSTAKGTTQSFSVQGVFSDNSTVDLTTQVQWHSSVTGVATISAQGVAFGVGVGTTTISATLGSVSNTAVLTVGPAVATGLDILPVNAVVPLGTLQPYQATGHFSDGTVADVTSLVTWESDDAGVATISLSGLATTKAIGSTTIRAVLGPVQQSTLLTVTAAVL
ncbi:MAG TPA: Ig-like domain-containing protein, partial [Candidatus Xenobia bacterium]